jgi:hypothetical protein
MIRVAAAMNTNSRAWSKTMSAAEKTTDHKEIRKWIESRGGRPARVTSTAPGHEDDKNGSGGILRVDFQEPDESLEEISWDEFFDIFEEHKLAFLYQEDTSGGRKSRFAKFVRRT